MDELQRYGLLSIACLIVLCLALTFRNRDHDAPLKPKAFATALDHGGASGRGASRTDRNGMPDPEPDPEHARPDPRQPASGGAGSGTGEQGRGGRDGDAGAAESERTWKVEPKDTLRKIARVRLGDEKRWPEIVAANPGLNPNALKPGVTLKIPAKSQAAGSDARGSDRALAADKQGKPDKQGQKGKSGSDGAESADKSDKKAKSSAPAKSEKKDDKPVAPKPKATSKSHRVARGDTLASISRKYYNDAMQWKRVYEANKSRMKSPTDLHEGLVLSLP